MRYFRLLDNFIATEDDHDFWLAKGAQEVTKEAYENGVGFPRPAKEDSAEAALVRLVIRSVRDTAGPAASWSAIDAAIRGFLA